MAKRSGEELTAGVLAVILNDDYAESSKVYVGLSDLDGNVVQREVVQVTHLHRDDEDFHEAGAGSVTLIAFRDRTVEEYALGDDPNALPKTLNDIIEEYKGLAVGAKRSVRSTLLGELIEELEAFVEANR